jgi:hypothetical protein
LQQHPKTVIMKIIHALPLIVCATVLALTAAGQEKAPAKKNYVLYGMSLQPFIGVRDGGGLLGVSFEGGFSRNNSTVALQYMHGFMLSFGGRKAFSNTYTVLYGYRVAHNKGWAFDLHSGAGYQHYDDNAPQQISTNYFVIPVYGTFRFPLSKKARTGPGVWLGLRAGATFSDKYSFGLLQLHFAWNLPLK